MNTGETIVFSIAAAGYFGLMGYLFFRSELDEDKKTDVKIHICSRNARTAGEFEACLRDGKKETHN